MAITIVGGSVNMKKTLSLVLILLIMIPFIVSCNDKITGTWGHNIHNHPDSDLRNDGGFMVEWVFSSRDKFWIVQYYRDGGGETGYAEEGTYSASGNTITLIRQNNVETYDFQFVGDNLVIGNMIFTRVSSSQTAPPFGLYKQEEPRPPRDSNHVPCILDGTTWEHIFDFGRRDVVVFSDGIFTKTIYNNDGSENVLGPTWYRLESDESMQIDSVFDAVFYSGVNSASERGMISGINEDGQLFLFGDYFTLLDN